MGYLANKKKNSRENIIFSGILFFFGLITLLTLGSTYCESLSKLAQFRFQYIFILLLISGIALYKLKFITFLTAVLFAFLNIAFISSSIKIFPKKQTDANVLAKVMFYNAKSKRPDYEKIKAEIKKEAPDILFLINAKNDLAESLKKEYPYFNERQEEQGIIIASKINWDIAEPLFLTAEKNINLVKFTLNNRPLLILFGQINEQSSQINSLINFVNSQNNPVILLSSLNTVPWDDDLYLLKEKSQLFYKGSIVSTYPSFMPAFLRLPYDHIYAHPSIEITNVRNGDFARTDRRALYFDISMPNLEKEIEIINVSEQGETVK